MLQRGLFNEELISMKKSEAAVHHQSLSKLILHTDVLADSVILKNTEYCQNMLVVLEVSSNDKITVGWVKKIVLRGDLLFFLVTKKVCYRSRMQYFESFGKSTEQLSSWKELKSFKPLLPRGTEHSFIFFLCGKLLDD